MCQVQTVVNAHTNKGYNTDGFDGTELVAHNSEKEAEERADFLGCDAPLNLCVTCNSYMSFRLSGTNSIKMQAWPHYNPVR